MKTFPIVHVKLEKIVGGGQTLGTLDDGRKIFVWGGLPEETVEVRITKKKSSYAEGVVTRVLNPSVHRIEPVDPGSYISTSPWQIVNFDKEQQYKAVLITEAFELHKLKLPGSAALYSDGRTINYRNKVEYSWWWDNESGILDLAFYQRGSKGKMPVDGTSLAREEINRLALSIRDLLRTKDVEARSLKTLLIRCDQTGSCVWQLYVRDRLPALMNKEEADRLPAQGGEIIYSDPRSPASKITVRLTAFGNTVLSDELLDKPYRYAAESFFQVNIPVYEKALTDMSKHMPEGVPVVDFYSGVGSIGLSLATDRLTLVEVDEHAYHELKNNIRLQNRKDSTQAVLAPAEKATDFITADAAVIVDPPRAGLHASVVERLLEAWPPRILYLSCNPVTQARDMAMLQERYAITYHQGYNFFPRTPHIEHLLVLSLR